MNNTEKILAEFESFDSFFAGLSMQEEKDAMKLYEKYVQSFFTTSITQALAEERERIKKELTEKLQIDMADNGFVFWTDILSITDKE